MAQRKQKVSLTLSADLVTLINRLAAHQPGGRSGVIEHVLRLWAKKTSAKQAAKDIDDATIAYYKSITPAELRENAEWEKLAVEALLADAD